MPIYQRQATGPDIKNNHLITTRWSSGHILYEHATYRERQNNGQRVFTNATPDHWCAPIPEIEQLGLPEAEVKSLILPRTPDNSSYEKCLMYRIDPQNLFKALPDYLDQRSVVVREDGMLRTVQTYTPQAAADDAAHAARIKELVLAVRSADKVACSHGWRYDTTLYRRTLVTEV
ncbi:hypothetical protein EVAR_80734_1 [Eumeta japonica]|uniref:Uncharacterized protein n=1 Tax=Eumeta variegata TaxID=151549 RepID=A0A4C1U4H5_EUMVA|nr:hypothetical protein EVAR_80734_1 [Eumeta japonica]